MGATTTTILAITSTIPPTTEEGVEVKMDMEEVTADKAKEDMVDKTKEGSAARIRAADKINLMTAAARGDMANKMTEAMVVKNTAEDKTNPVADTGKTVVIMEETVVKTRVATVDKTRVVTVNNTAEDKSSLETNTDSKAATKAVAASDMVVVKEGETMTSEVLHNTLARQDLKTRISSHQPCRS